MKTKSIILLAFALLISVCASSQTRKEKRTINSFDKIAVSSIIDIHFTQGSTYSLDIETNLDDMSTIETKVQDGNLSLSIKNKGKLKKDAKVKVYLSAPTINAIVASGSSDFYCKELTNKTTLNIAVSGGADIDIEKLNAEELNLAASGGSDIDIKHLTAKICNLATSGGSDADIHIDSANEMNVASNGGSDVELSGTVKKISIASNGGSDVDIKDLKYETINNRKTQK